MFLEPVDPELLCGICSFVCRELCETTCGHTFCRLCIVTRLAATPTCPVDSRTLSGEMFHPAVRDQGRINSMQVRCPESGCSATFPLSQLDEHRQQACSERQVSCDACGAAVAARDLPAHMQEAMAEHVAALSRRVRELEEHNSRLLARWSERVSEDGDGAGFRNPWQICFQGLPSGVYPLSLDAGPPVRAYVDAETDGGGWVLVLNYLHQGGTAPELTPMSDALPVLGASQELGVDGSREVGSWGHATPELLRRMRSLAEVRMFGRTNAHSRVIHFKASHPQAVRYFQTGSGYFGDAAMLSFEPFPDHTALLPGHAKLGSGVADRGSDAMCCNPFWVENQAHWNIHTRWYGSQPRFEVDDYNNGSAYHTHHQVWVRPSVQSALRYLAKPH